MAATAEETLAQEERHRPRAGVTAIAAGVLTMLGSLLLLSVSDDFPTVPLLDALRSNVAGGPSAGPGVVARKVLYYDDHAAQLILSQLVPSVALALVAIALTFLYRFALARSPELNKVPLYTAVAGGVLVLFPAIVAVVARTLEVSAFANSADQSERAARDVLGSPIVATADYLVDLGTLAIGVAFGFTAYRAMRVGLLTRFMGVLGIIVALLFVLPLEAQLPLVKVFWLLGLGALFLGRWPGGVPPAWTTGTAQPWPTQQELREARLAQRGEGGKAAKRERERERTDERERRQRGGRAEPPETPAPEPPRSRPHPSSKKKKRKRR